MPDCFTLQFNPFLFLCCTIYIHMTDGKNYVIIINSFYPCTLYLFATKFLFSSQAAVLFIITIVHVHVHLHFHFHLHSHFDMHFILKLTSYYAC